MSNFELSRRSREALLGVHSDLVLLVARAIQLSEIDFVVTEGVRSEARQRALIEAGASRTMNSRHRTGHAIDVAAWVDGGVRWDWPLYRKINEGFERASAALGVPVEWGGHWVSFPDGPHFQLPLAGYHAQHRETIQAGIAEK